MEPLAQDLLKCMLAKAPVRTSDTSDELAKAKAKLAEHGIAMSFSNANLVRMLRIPSQIASGQSRQGRQGGQGKRAGEELLRCPPPLPSSSSPALLLLPCPPPLPSSPALLPCPPPLPSSPLLPPSPDAYH